MKSFGTGKSISMFAVVAAITAVILAGCDSAGAGGGGGGGTSTCTGTGDYTVTWEFSGTYTDTVSIATTWVKPSGELSDPFDPKYASIDPSSGVLLTETLPACSGASINLTTIKSIADNDDTITLSNVTLSIAVNGTVADSVVLNGTYADGVILPGGDALTVVVGQ